jgi:hypothetical protein
MSLGANVGSEWLVLDAIPLAGAWRQIDDPHGEASLVEEALEFAFPRAGAGATAATAVSG